MFINCPHCRALVATDPATDLPPPRCPRCAAQLRDEAPATAVAAPAIPTSAGVPADAAAPDAPSQAAPVDFALDAPLEHGEAPLQENESASTIHSVPTKPAGGFTLARLLRRPAVDDAPAAPASPTSPESPESPASTIASDATAATGMDESRVATPAVAGPPPPRLYAVLAMPDVRRDTGADAAIDAATTAASTPAATSTPRPAAAPEARHAPSFARGRTAAAPASRREQWTLAAAIAGLSLLLAVQWVVADRDTLGADARWRPLVQHVCAALRCAVPPWREPAALVLLDRDVRPDTTVADALRVTATFRNDASWPQAWPLLQLTLSDVDGITVAEGTFAAADYLGAAPSQPLLAPGQVATVRMVVAEPTPRSVAFAFAFR